MMNQNGIPTSVGETEADYAFAKKARVALESSSDLIFVGMAGHILLNYGVMVKRLQIDAELMNFVESLLKKAGMPLDNFHEIKGMLATSPDKKRALAAVSSILVLVSIVILALAGLAKMKMDRQADWHSVNRARPVSPAGPGKIVKRTQNGL